jgi:hypothetical protein
MGRDKSVSAGELKFPPFFGQVMKPRFMVGLQSTEGGTEDGAEAENTFRGV